MASQKSKSTLQDQLQILRSAQPSTQNLRKSSLLFDPHTAANMALLTVQNLGNEGLEELIGLDERFQVYRNTLFNVSAIEINRDLQTADANEKIDLSVRSFLRLASPYFLLRPCHKALEWLIRRFRIFEGPSVDDVIKCILPYHQTNLFARMVHILVIPKGSHWDFLEGVKTTGTPLETKTLLGKAHQNLLLIESVGEYVKEMVAENTAFSTLLSFYASFLTQFIGSSSNLSIELLNAASSQIFQCLSTKKKEMQTIGFMAISQMSAKTPLSYSLLLSFFKKLGKTATEASFADALLCLIFLCQSQKISSIPPKLILNFASNQDFVPVLNQFSYKSYDMDNFLLNSLKSLLENSFESKESLAVLLNLIEEAPIKPVVAAFVSLLLQKQAKSYKSGKEEETIKVVSKILKSLDKIHFNELDAGVEQALKVVTDPKSSDSIHSENLLDFVGIVFKGTRHECIQAEKGQTTLFLSLEHSNPHVRLASIDKLKDLAKKKQDSDKMFVEDSLIRRLNDEDSKIVEKTLSFPQLESHVDSNLLFPVLLQFLKKRETEESIQLKAFPILSKILDASIKENSVSHKDLNCSLLSASLPHLFTDSKLSRTILEYYSKSGNQIFYSVEKNSKLEEVLEKIGKNIGNQWINNSPLLLALYEEYPETRRALSVLFTSALNQSSSDSVKIQIGELIFPQLQADLEKVNKDATIQKIASLAFGAPNTQFLRDYFVNFREDEEKSRDLNFFFVENLISNLPQLASFEQIFAVTKVHQETDFTFRNFLLLTKIYTVLSELPKNLGLELIQKLLKTHLPNPVNLARFLTLFWFYFEDKSSQTKSLSVKLLSSFVLSFSSSIDFQFLVPSLLSVLFDGEQSVRKSAIFALEEIEKKQNKGEATQIFGQQGFYPEGKVSALKGSISNLFLSSVLAQKTSILESPTFLEDFLEEFFENPDANREAITNYLISTLIQLEGETGKRNLLRCIQKPTKENLKNISSFLSTLISRLLDDNQPHPLSDSEVEILVLFAKKISAQNIIYFKSKEKLFESLQEVMNFNLFHLANTPRKEQFTKVKVALFEAFTNPENFGALGKKEKEEIFIQVCGLEQQPSIKLLLSPDLVSNLPLEMTIVTSLLASFYKVGAEQASIGKKLKRSFSSSVEDSEKQTSDKFLSVNLLMEQIPALQNSKEFSSLTPHLFALLKKFVLEETLETGFINTTVEYSVQLCLNSINTVVQTLEKREGTKENSSKTPKKNQKEENTLGIDVEILISTLRSTMNMQIHTNVLQCLTSLTSVVPEQITKFMMPLFTVMGNASLSSSENNYSWMIVKRAVEQVIPALINNKVEATFIVSTFVDSFSNISIHRRVSLFLSLSTSLKTCSGKDFLAAILLSLYCKEILNAESNVLPKEEESVSEFGHALFNELKPTQICKTLYQMMEAVVLSSHLASQEEKKKWNEIESAGMKQLFKPSQLSKSSQTSLAQAVTEFIEDHITSPKFLDDLLVTNAVVDQQNVQSSFLLIFQMTLQHLQHASEATKNGENVEEWKSLTSTGYEILDSLNELLAIPGFIACISKLLEHSDPQIRKRALVLFNEKLEAEKEGLSPKLADLFVEMTEKLIGIINKKAEKELDYTKQSALLSLEILARNFGKSHQQKFVALVPSLIRGALQHTNPQVVSSAAICLASISSEVGNLIFPHLSQFLPLFLKNLAVQEKEKDKKGRVLLQLSMLSSLEVVITNLSKFLSPHLSLIVKSITDPDLLQSKDKQLKEKVKAVFVALSSNVEPRLLIAAILDVYKKVYVMPTLTPLVHLLGLLSDVCARLEAEAVQTNSQNLFKFFLGLFDLTVKKNDVQVETAVVDAFMSLVLKLNENLFRPFFASVVDWAQVSKGNPPTNAKETSRSTFFFRIMDSMCNKLKSIVVTYYGPVLDHAIACLKFGRTEKRKTTGGSVKGDDFFEEESSSSDEESSSSEEEGEEENLGDRVRLVRYVLSSLRQCFLHDNEGFVTKERFDKLHVAIVDQLDNMIGTSEDYEYRVSKLLVPTLTQLALCVGQEVLWKPLNNQILLKTRSESAQVRYSALRVIQELYSRLGEEVLVLVPETVPFISELMEDSNSKVEELVRDIVKLMEQQLGEDAVSSYL